MRRWLLLFALLAAVLINNLLLTRCQRRIHALEAEIGPGRGHVPRAPERHFPAIDVYSQMLPQGDRAFLAVTRFTRQQFDEMVTELAPLVQANRHVRPHVPEPGGEIRATKLSLHNRLLLALKFLTCGGTCEDLGQQFALSPAAVSEEIRHVVFALVAGLSYEIAWPPPVQQQQLQQLLGPRFPHAIGTLDGTFTQSFRRLGDYSGHRHLNIRHHQIACDALGFVIHVVAGQVGSRHDAYQFARTDLGARLAADDVDLLVDSGYRGFPHLLPPATITTIPDRTARIAYNIDHTSRRSRFIGRIKALFTVASRKWQRAESFVCIVAACILYNRRKRQAG